MRFYISIVTVLFILVIGGCGSNNQHDITRLTGIIEQQCAVLDASLAQNKIENAQLLKIYAAVVKKEDIYKFGIGTQVQEILFNPNLTALVKKSILEYNNIRLPLPLIYLDPAKAKNLPSLNDQLTSLVNKLNEEAYSSSPTIIKLRNRLAIAKDTPQVIGSSEDVLNELYALVKASQTQTYNDSLIDAINVIADISQGALASINQEEQSMSTRGDKQPGRHLVGNPNYGSWQNNNGQSFWVWYGQYSMLRSLFARPYSYHSWYHNRPYSYYNDYGRGAYGSKNDLNNVQKTHAINKKKVKSYGAKNNIRRSRPLVMTSTRRYSNYSTSQRAGVRSRSNFMGK